MKFVAFLAPGVALGLLGCSHHKSEPVAAARTEVTNAAPAHHVETKYTKPITSLGAKFGWLPPAAQNTVRAEAGSEEVVDVIKEASADKLYYKVVFRDAANFPPLLVTPDGSVLNPDLTVAVAAPLDSTGSLPLTPVTVQDLPAPVQDVLREKAPGADVSNISKEAWGNHLVYVISFKTETPHPKLYIVADGTTLTPASSATKP
jgi:hypothetical protein